MGGRLFKSRLERHMILRIVLFWGGLIIVALFLRHRWPLMAGLTAGALLGAARFICSSRLFSAVKNAALKMGYFIKLILYLLLQALTVALLFLTYKTHVWFFIGCVSGVLFPPMAIIVNSITEAVGLTKNGFYVE